MAVRLVHEPIPIVALAYKERAAGDLQELRPPATHPRVAREAAGQRTRASPVTRAAKPAGALSPPWGTRMVAHLETIRPERGFSIVASAQARGLYAGNRSRS